MDDLFKAIEQVAARKRQAAEFRKLGVDPTLEKAQDVVSAVARQLAARFAGDGFKFAASGRRKLTRKVGDWTQEVHLDGGGANSAGRKIHFAVFAFVRNAALRRWQQKKPSAFFHAGHWPKDVAVVSHRFVPGWRERDAQWDLTDPAKRARAVDAAEAHIRGKILPVLEQFTERDALREMLLSDTRTDWVGRLVRLDLTIDLLLCYFDPETAARAVDQFVAAHASSEDFPTRLAFAFAKARAGHPPENVSDTEIVAVAVHRYDLPVTHPLLTKLQTAALPPYDPLAERELSHAAAAQTQGELVRLLRAAGYHVE